MTAATAPLRKKARLRRWAAWGARHGPRWFVRLAPPVIGAVFALVSRDARRQVTSNLRRIHGCRSPLIEAWDVLRTFVAFAHALTRSLSPPSRLSERRVFRVRGRHHVVPFVNAGRGFVMVTAHVGPWDAAAMGMSIDVKVMMVMSPEEDAAASEFQDGVRGAAEVEVLRAGDADLQVLRILEHLQAGGVVVAQVDRVPAGRKSIAVELFGEPFAFPEGLFRLAAAAQVPLVPVFCAQLSETRALVDVSPPLWVLRGARGSALVPSATEVARRLEAHLAAFPTQWFHFASSTQSPDSKQVRAGASPVHLAKAPP